MYAILDEGFICHAACSVDGTVWMIPTAYARDGDRLILHGAAANHVLKAAAAGAELTVTVTLVDGLVLARSTFNHSINYRSVVVFGSANDIADPADKAEALERDRGAHAARAQQPTPARPTRSSWPRPGWCRLPLDEVSAKVRSGGPIDEDGRRRACRCGPGSCRCGPRSGREIRRIGQPARRRAAGIPDGSRPAGDRRR